MDIDLGRLSKLVKETKDIEQKIKNKTHTMEDVQRLNLITKELSELINKKIKQGDLVTHSYYGPGSVYHTENGNAQVMFERDSVPFNLTVVPLESLERVTNDGV